MEAASDSKKRAILPAERGGETGAAGLAAATSCQTSAVKVSKVSSTCCMGYVLSQGCGLSCETQCSGILLISAIFLTS